jgi:hypothetical protein
MGLYCQRKLRNAESGLSAVQDFGELDGVQGGAFAQIGRHVPTVDTLSDHYSLHDIISKQKS